MLAARAWQTSIRRGDAPPREGAPLARGNVRRGTATGREALCTAGCGCGATRLRPAGAHRRPADTVLLLRQWWGTSLGDRDNGCIWRVSLIQTRHSWAALQRPVCGVTRQTSMPSAQAVGERACVTPVHTVSVTISVTHEQYGTTGARVCTAAHLRGAGASPMAERAALRR